MKVDRLHQSPVFGLLHLVILFRAAIKWNSTIIESAVLIVKPRS